MAKLTIVGMYNYDQSLFDGLTFPTGIDKDIAVNEILMRSGEFCALYTDPVFMKLQIGIWGQKHYRTFEKWIEALSEDFNPLYNYDRHEEYTDTEETGKTGKTTLEASGTSSSGTTGQVTTSDTSSTDDIGTDTNSRTESGTETVDEDIDNDSTVENSVSAYDSSSYSPKDKTVTDQTTARDVSTTKSASISETFTKNDNTSTTASGSTISESSTTGSTDDSSETNTEESGNRLLKHEAHLYGNIGVTTSTQMLEDYLRVERWNIYENIADIFVDEFCIQIY